AVVALLFILIPIVKISGNMGSFTSTSIALDIIQELQHNLKPLSPGNAPPLFPPLRLDPNFGWNYAFPSQSVAAENEPEEDTGDLPPTKMPGYKNLEMWPKMALWAGMNNSWRPCKEFLV